MSRKNTMPSSRLVVFTDLDGTLLDPESYSYDAARPALRELNARHIPVVLASSKTRAELERIRYQLANREPFVTENGGALFIPKGTFEFPLSGAILRGAYQVVEFGTPYPKLRLALAEIARAADCELKGFGDMSVDEIVQRTGLTMADAVLAKQREYDEPFIIIGTPARPEGDATDARELKVIEYQAELRGLRCSAGGRFYHLLGIHDKGQACRYLIDCYRRHYGEACRVVTIALGDSENDLPMLAQSDHAVLVQRLGGHYASTSHPDLFRAKGIGPVGWNEAVLRVLRTL